MSERPPAPAPRIEGFTFVKVLGSGGFADVYLYQQGSPRRDVAVKVLISEMAGTGAAERLNKEADAMAGLSQHQNIVTVLHSGLSSDRRPYMVMEYYSRPALSQGLKQSQRSLASVLSIGIQLAGAVESAHRLGILHRDIKPANILQDRWGRPVLGDFGIAMTNAEAQRGDAQGMSIPWSPPESFSANPTPLVQSDIWSLAATVYALLTGRPPFEDVGGDNRPYAMMDRIKNSPYRPTGRTDVPASLEQVLATAMAKSPWARYPSMKAFGTALREIEQELALPQTPMDVIDDSVGEAWGDDPEISGTRLRPITVIDPTGATDSWPSSPGSSTGGANVSNITVSGGTPTSAQQPKTSRPAEPGGEQIADRRSSQEAPTGFESIDRTELRAPANSEQVETEEPEVEVEQKKPMWRLVLVAVAVVVIAALVLLVTRLYTPEEPAPFGDGSSSPSSVPQDPLGGGSPPAPVDLAGEVDEDAAHFTWTNPSPKPGDFYSWNVVGKPSATRVFETVVDVPIPEGQGSVCIVVRIVRSGVSSPEAQACAI
ncbi:MAG: serine/threonine protein kinase [Propionibacteriaceae bacterium]|jgi:serine/threonine protein kinase|nr:serine/threonine protein kinase [Propionibacteriaceae bacterium]